MSVSDPTSNGASSSSSSFALGLGGLGSGIDWTKYIDAVRTGQENAVQKTLVTHKTSLSKQQQVINQIKVQVDDLKGVVSGFAFAKDFKTKQVNSSAPTAVTATANLQAQNVAFSVDVTARASNELWIADFTSADNPVTNNDKTFTIDVRGTSKNISVPAGTTLTAFAQLINSSNAGVTAIVYDTHAGSGNTARLSIQDNTTGQNDPTHTAGVFNLSFSGNLDNFDAATFTNNVPGSDAQFSVNGGETLYRSTNTVTDVIPGVTLNLLTTTSSTAQLTVSDNATTSGQKVKDFIAKYNTLVSTLRKAVAFNPSETVQSNPTAGNDALTTVLNQLTGNVLGYVPGMAPGNSIQSLTDLGVTSVFSGDTAATNGTLQFPDDTKFNDAIANHFDDLMTFFQGVVNPVTQAVIHPGFGQYIGGIVDGFTKAGTGVLTSKVDSLTTQISTLQKQIDKKYQSIQDNEDRLKQRFAQLETLMSSLNQQQNSLNSALNAMGAGGGSSKK